MMNNILKVVWLNEDAASGVSPRAKNDLPYVFFRNGAYGYFVESYFLMVAQ
jgi:hypothetical protein